MAATAWTIHDDFINRLGNSLIDIDSDDVRMALFQSTSNAETESVGNFSQLTNQTTAGNGYTSGGIRLTSVRWTESNGVNTFDASDVTWTASGGSIAAQIAVIYDNTDAAKTVICHSTLDPSTINITTGNSLTVQINAAGIFTADSTP